MTDPIDPASKETTTVAAAAPDGLRRLAGHVQRLLAAIPVLSLILTIVYLVSVADRGLDLTDEGFYLLHARDPDVSNLASVTAFGYYTGILYWLAGGEIAWFRILGGVTLLASGGLFSVGAVLAINRHLRITDTTFALIAKVAFVLLGILLHYSSTTLTPNYNLLMLVVITTAAGAFLFGLDALERPASRRRATLWFVLVGAALALGGFTKATSGVLLTGLLLVVGLVWPGVDWRQRGRAAAAVLAGGSGVVCVHAVFLQSPVAYVEAVQRGLVGLSTMDPTYGWALVDRVREQVELLRTKVLTRFGWWYVGLPLVTLLAGGLVATTRWRSRLLASLSMLGMCVGFWIAYESSDYLGGQVFYHEKSVTYWSWALLLGGVATSAAIVSWERVEGVGRAGFARLLLLSVVWLVSPVVYAFGSNNHLVVASSTGIGVSFGAILVGFGVLTKATDSRWIAAVGIAGLAVLTASVVTTAGAAPYRLNSPLDTQVVETDIGVPPTRLRLDQNAHAFLDDMGRFSADCGFTPGEDIIDLSGQFPGLVFALGGRSPGTAWYLGGFPGSHEATAYYLSLLTNERRRSAWVLSDSRVWRYAITPGPTLEQFGISFPGDFELCGAAHYALWGRDLQLWRPAQSPDSAQVALVEQRAQDAPSAATFLELARAYQEMDLWTNSLEAAARVLEFDAGPGEAGEALTLQCLANLELGDWERAVDTCGQAAAQLPESAEATSNLGRAQQGQQFQVEIDQWEQVVVSAPSPPSFVNLSLAYFRAGRYAESAEAARSAAIMAPDMSVAFNNMCAAFNSLGQWDDAIASCTRALEIEPDNTLARNNLNLAQSSRAAP